MKSAKTIMLLGLVGVLGFAAYRVNQKPEAPKTEEQPAYVVDDKAKEVLERADAASKKVNAFTYNATYHVDRGDKRMEGTVRANEEPFLMAIDVKRSSKGSVDGDSFVSATDGETVYHIAHARKEFVHGVYPERGFLLRLGSELVMQEFGHDSPFSSELEGKFRYERQESVGDVLCDVIYVEYKSAGQHARWFFGADGLPRRVERMSYMFPDLPPEQQLKKTLTLTELDVAPQLAAAGFRQTLPEGYKEIELPPPVPLLAAGSVAPDWSLRTPDGRTVSLASLRGNVVVMDFWATWCGPCKMAMPGIQKLHEHFEGKPVTVVGVNCQDPDGDPAAYMAKKSYTYTLLMKGDQAAEAYSVMALPTVYVIDTKGKVAQTIVGAGDEEKLIGIVQGLLPTDRTASADSGA